MEKKHAFSLPHHGWLIHAGSVGPWLSCPCGDKGNDIFDETKRSSQHSVPTWICQENGN